ncbi:MAG: amidophosphoribosyltransferase [Sphingobacteriales bacterium 41-5]|nr:MAG: amidophosphoribosyltransferase [Sphingobacteriales bacterium 41-5]
MSDPIKHECGLAFIRLRKRFSYYQKEYGTVMWGLNKLYLLMEKQHNRGQDGAGIATVKLHVEPGYPYMHRVRSAEPQAIASLFKGIAQEINDLTKYNPDITNHAGLMKGHVKFLGELLLGHLRYGTQGKNNADFCHPFIKRHTIPARNLALAGNFNLVNTEELFEKLGITPGPFQKQSDLAAMMEVVHKYLVDADIANPGRTDIKEVLKEVIPQFDGGFTVGGLTGDGNGFVFRDAHGIRPCYYYISDEVIVAASERSAIRTAFNVGENEVKELMPGNALIVKENGDYEIAQVIEPKERRACSFERIYFSRGSDEKIYKERKALGYNLSQRVLEAIDFDLKNTIFSYIPNTAETAFFGLQKGMQMYLNKIKVERILSWDKDFDEEKLSEMINRRIRFGKIAIKDVKMRTFITEDASRNEMVQHVYDVTYGTVRPGVDTLVVIDDSIVRGTTLKQSIIRMLGRLQPKKIIILSSSPQIRYPDCYGIDMSKMGDFIAFIAAVEVLKDNGREHLLQELWDKCKQLKEQNQLHIENVVRQLYKESNVDEITDKIAEMITPAGLNIPVQVIFQSIEDLHKACPNNLGDWYFTGNYPTPGGNRVVNQAFMNYMEGKNERGY